MHSKFGWVPAMIVAILGGTALWWQNVRLASLRAEVVALRGVEVERSRQRVEQERHAALQVSSFERERLRSEQLRIEQLHDDVKSLRNQLEQSGQSSVVETREPERLSMGEIVPAQDWTNRGTATPAAALETALWAAAGGDVDAFAALLLFDATSLRAAQTLLDSLPGNIRAQHTTPERLIAFLTIKDVPLGSVQVRRWSEARENVPVMANLTFADSDGRQKDVMLPFFHRDDRWQLVVVERTVAHYTAMLQGRSERSSPGAESLR